MNDPSLNSGWKWGNKMTIGTPPTHSNVLSEVFPRARSRSNSDPGCVPPCSATIIVIESRNGEIETVQGTVSMDVAYRIKDMMAAVDCVVGYKESSFKK